MYLFKKAMFVSSRIFLYFCCILLCIGLFSTSSYASDEKKSAPDAAVIYTPVPVLVVALYSKGRPSGFLSVSSSLLMDSQEDRVFAEKVMPRLKAYYMQDLMSLSNKYFNVKYPINSNMISQVLQKATNRALKHNRAKFYILNVTVQKKQ